MRGSPLPWVALGADACGCLGRRDCSSSLWAWGKPGAGSRQRLRCKRLVRSGIRSSLASAIRGALSATLMLGDYLEFRVQLIGGSAHDRETGRPDVFNEGLDADTGHLGGLCQCERAVVEQA